MTASTTKRRFTDDFKREAVALWETSGRAQIEVIIPRFGGHARLAGHALLGLLGRKIPEGRVHAVPIAIALDVSEQRLSRFGLCRPSALMDEFDLEGVEEALHRGIIVTEAPRVSRRLPLVSRSTGNEQDDEQVFA